STAAGQKGTPVANGIAATEFIDSSLVNGTTYYYQVASASAAGVGTPTAQVSAKPLALGTPASVKAVAGDARATLSWNAATSAASYNIFRATQSGQEGDT